MKNKILIVFGTRPEAIKLVPIIHGLLKKKKKFNLRICITGQHNSLLYPILDFFKIKADYDMKVMKNNQNLSYLSSVILDNISKILEKEKPNYVMVHGDTTTTFVTALASFYKNIKLLHIEAGLRTNNISAPFPEEFNRLITSKIAYKHFAPTLENKKNLLNEQISSNKIYVTGNTSIDTLKLTINLIEKNTKLKKNIENFLNKKLNFNYVNEQFILLTVHRRENFGEGVVNIFKAIQNFAKNNKNLHIIFPVHPNPNVKKIANNFFGSEKNLHIIKPLNYEHFVFLLNKCFFVISDSGGIQEEAPFLGKPIIVLREKTERPALTKKQNSIIVGSNQKKIIYHSKKLIKNKNYYNNFSSKNFYFGDGKASDKIINIMEKF